MSKIEEAVKWITEIANDNSHGYSQINRWGQDYDCSSLVISAWKQAGVPLSCTYTGNMKADMLNNGFSIVTDGTLQAGDVLLNEIHHTAMMINSTQLAQASCDENGGIRGDTPGDQTGSEINISHYYNFPWDFVLRYTESKPATKDVWVVKKGDTLWSISMESGVSQDEIARLNNIPDKNMIYIGQILKLKDDGNNEGSACSDIHSDACSDSERTVTINAGDTLWCIAEKYLGNGIRWKEIAELNGIDNQYMLKIGQKIKIPY